MSTYELSDELKADQAALLAEIYAAFEGVTREGGVSWNESLVRDMYGTEEEALAARRTDTDASWHELLDNPEWRPDAGMGGWSFLDAVGFRYYLPAGMIRCLRLGYDAGIEFHLTLREKWEAPIYNSGLKKQAESDARSHDYRLEQWSALDLRQKRCIRWFVAHMRAISKFLFYGDPDAWEEALASYWRDFDRDL